MSNEIIKILDDLAKRFGVAIDWTAENVMPYLKDLLSRLVTFEIVQSAILIVVSVLMLIACIVAGKFLSDDRKLCRTSENSTTFHTYRSCFNSVELEDGFGFAYVVGIIIVGIAAVIMFGCNLDALLKWTIIPEFKIIEWISNQLTTLGG